MKRIASFVALGLFAAAPLDAQTRSTQACVGNPARSGQSAVAGAVGFTDGAISYGGAFNHNAQGPYAVGFGGSVVDFDNTDVNAYTIGGDVSIELFTDPVGICPVFGATYVRFETIGQGANEINVDGWVFPIGVGIGGTIRSQTGLRVIPFVIPAIEIVHADADVEFAGFAFDGSDTDAHFAIRAGATLAGDTLFGFVTVADTSVENSDPVVTLGAGVVF